jgi:hypothetical protein
MIKVRIVELEEQIQVATKLPKIPERGDQICCYFHNNDFRICNITSIRYYLSKSGKFDEVEIGVQTC